LRDHRSPKIFSAEELPFIESRWLSTRYMPAWGPVKKHSEKFAKYVWNKGITLYPWIYISLRKEEGSYVYPLHSKWETNSGVRSLSILRSGCTNPVPLYTFVCGSKMF
jgi:hypothetical protein